MEWDCVRKKRLFFESSHGLPNLHYWGNGREWKEGYPFQERKEIRFFPIFPQASQPLNDALYEHLRNSYKPRREPESERKHDCSGFTYVRLLCGHFQWRWERLHLFCCRSANLPFF